MAISGVVPLLLSLHSAMSTVGCIFQHIQCEFSRNLTKVKLPLKIIAQKCRPCFQETTLELSWEPLLAALLRTCAEERTIASTSFCTNCPRKCAALSCKSSKLPRTLHEEYYKRRTDSCCQVPRALFSGHRDVGSGCEFWVAVVFARAASSLKQFRKKFPWTDGAHLPKRNIQVMKYCQTLI